MVMIPAETIRMAEQEAADRAAANRPSWSCAARKQALPEPGECDWPVCGCDPYANKVIAALEESGALSLPNGEQR